MSIKLPIIYDVDIECCECSETINQKIKIQNIEFANSYERGMGTETQYDFRAEITCPYCKETFEVEGEVWEYPESVINLIQLT